jgi:Regulator of G protein signaling domain
VNDIVQGKTCVPISLHEFRLFLKHHEHSLENLDFFLWYQDYKRRWDQLPLPAKLQSPPPQEKPSYVGYVLSGTGKRQQQRSAMESGDSDWIGTNSYPNETMDYAAMNPKHSSTGGYKQDSSSIMTASTYANGYELTSVVSPESYYQGTIPDQQPFRDEVELVLKAFFTSSSDKELNIDGYLRQYVLHNSKYTTHPDVFEPVRDKVYETIERSSLRNFVNYALQNINHGGVIVRYLLAGTCAVLIAMVLIITFVLKVPRWYRIFIFPLVIGMVICSISANQGVCFQRAMGHRRDPHAYELVSNGQVDDPFAQEFNFGDVESQSEDIKAVKDPLVRRYNMVSDSLRRWPKFIYPLF